MTLLIDKNKQVNVNIGDRRGFTPLHAAVGIGNEEMVKQLLDKADVLVNVVDEYGETPLHIAAAIALPDIGQRLLKVATCFDFKETSFL